MTTITDTIINADNLDVMASMPGAGIDLIYCDPPFMTGTDFGEYDDRFAGIDDYAAFMQPRIAEFFRILKPAGALYLHCDTRTSAHFRLWCDAASKNSNLPFLNEIVWQRTRVTGLTGHSKGWGRVCDRILVYAKRVRNKDAVATMPDLDDPDVAAKYPHADERGRYQSVCLTADGLKKLGAGSPRYEFLGHVRHWQYSEANMHAMLADGRIILPKKPGGLPRRKCYAHETKTYPTDLWTDTGWVEAGSAEKTGYPTQKPESLLERIVLASTDANDVVFEPFLGSGTACSVAKRLGRHYVGCDINGNAIDIARGRLGPAMIVADDDDAA